MNGMNTSENHTDTNPSLLDIDNIEFKAITKGLGFKKDNDEIVLKPKKSKRETYKTELPQSASMPETSQVTAQNHYVFRSHPQNAFNESKISKAPTQEANKLMYTAAKDSQKFMAWIIDMLAVVSIFTAIWGSALALLGVDFNIVSSFMFSFESILMYSTSFFFIYCFYQFVCLITLESTLGAHYYQLKVLDKSHNRMTALQALQRSFFSTISLVFGGMPLLVNFHGILSDTEVVSEI